MHKLIFLRSLSKKPFQTGALLPSSRHLGSAIREGINVLPKMPVVELGAGTGSITQCLQDTKPALVEIDQHMSKLLTNNFPQCEVHNTCAVKFLNDINEPCGLVVSLPLINNPMKHDIVQAIQSAYQKGSIGWCVIFTYGFKSPLSEVGFKSGRKFKTVFRNVPPAHVWVYR